MRRLSACLSLVLICFVPAFAGTALTVRVQGPDGSALKGARVVARGHIDEKAKGAAPAAIAEAVAADGSAKLDVAGACPCAVRADLAGYAPAVVKDVSGTEPVVVTLRKGAALDGQVFDVVTNKPLAGVEILVFGPSTQTVVDPDAPERFAPRAVTGEDGRFRLADLAAEDASVVARAEGRRTGERPAKILDGGNAPVMFYLGPGVPVSGRVVDPSGKPVRGAHVSVHAREIRAQIEAGRASATTKADGTFLLHGLPPARGYVLRVTHDAWADAQSPEINATAGRRPAPLTITLRRGGTARATLRAGETPFAGKASARITYEGTGPVQSRIVQREAEVSPQGAGVLTLDRLPEGTASVLITAEGYARLPAQKVRFDADKATDLGTLTLERGRARAGRVLDVEGKAVGGARIRAVGLSMTGASEASATSAEDGSFTLAGLAENVEYRVAIEKEGVGAVTLSGLKSDGTGPLEVTLEPLSTLRGKVVTGDPAEPVSFFSIEATRVTEGGMMALLDAVGGPRKAQTIRDAAGTLELTGVSAGAYTVTVSSPGYVPARLEKVEVARGEPLDLGEVRLARGATLRVSVVDKKTKQALGGAGVSRAETGMFAAAREMMQSEGALLTGPDGRATLDGLAPGRVTLKVRREGYAATKADVDIAPDAVDVDTTVALGQGGAVEGTVRDRDGRIRAGSLVLLSSGMDASPDLMDLTDEGGNYHIERIPPAGYMVVVTPMRDDMGSGEAPSAEMMSQLQMQAVTIEEDKTARIDFPVGSGKVTVRGVARRGSSPIAGRMFWVRDTGGGIPSDFVTATIGSDGHYQVRLGSAGKYQVRVQGGDDMADPGYGVNVEIPEGQTEVEQDIVEPEGVLAGRVIDVETSMPVKAASVTALRLRDDGEVDTRDPLGAAARADEDGNVRVSGLRDGSYRVVVSAPGYALARIGPVTIDGDDEQSINAALERAPALEIRTVDTNGAPVQGAIVLAEEELYTAFGRMEGLTDGTGRAVLRNLGRGTHVLVALVAGFAPQRITDVVIGERAPEPLEIRLERGGGLKLTVTDAAGQPVAGAGLRLREEGGTDISNLAYFARVMAGRGFGLGTDAAGMAELDPLPPGTLQVEIVRNEEVLARKTVKIRSGQTEAATIKLP